MLAGQGPGADLQPTCGTDQVEWEGVGECDAGKQSRRIETQKVSESKKKIARSRLIRSTVLLPAGKTVRVKRGDTLNKIAKRYHVKGDWKGLWKLNKKTIKNSNLIYIGQVIKIK